MDLDAAHILSQDCKFCLFNMADNRYQRKKKEKKKPKEQQNYNHSFTYSLLEDFFPLVVAEPEK